MNIMDVLLLKNSTIGRSIMTALSRVAPGAAERHVAHAFRRPLPLLRPSPPQVAGLAAHRFQVDADGEQLAAWDWGDARGPTVLLVHGWNGQAAQLSRFVAPLVAAGFYVVAFDQPAHGLSSGSEADLPSLARAVAAVGRKVGPVRGVIAHSLGAAATVLAMANGLDVGRAVLLAPPAEPIHFARGFAARMGLPAERFDGMIAQVGREAGSSLERLDLRRLVRSLRVPALVVHDPEDREVPFSHGRSLAEAWPGARLLAVPRLGHRRLLGDPSVIAEAVDFVVGAEVRLERRSA
jgi:pimeloyl-ACP methyl ester carboxylesterase